MVIGSSGKSGTPKPLIWSSRHRRILTTAEKAQVAELGQLRLEGPKVEAVGAGLGPGVLVDVVDKVEITGALARWWFFQPDGSISA